MAAVTPPLFLNVDGVYTAASLATPYRDLVAEGVVNATDLAVAQRGAGANMSVDVAAGTAWVQGDSSATQPIYRCYNDATVNLAVSAAHATLPRIDIVVAEVRDAAFAGVSSDWRPRVIAGTPTSGATLTNRAGAPALPASCLWLADVLVPGAATTVVTANIGNKRANAGAGAALAPEHVTALPPNPYDGQEVYFSADPTNGVNWHLRYRAASASAYKWEFVGGPPLTAQEDTDRDTGSTTFVELGTALRITAPLAGDYMAWHTARCGYVAGGPGVGGTDATLYLNGVDTGAFASVWNDVAGVLSTAANAKRITVTTAGHVVDQRGKAPAGTTSRFGRRSMSLTPIRVG